MVDKLWRSAINLGQRKANTTRKRKNIRRTRRIGTRRRRRESATRISRRRKASETIIVWMWCILNLLTIILFAGTLDAVLETLRKIEMATESNTESIHNNTESIRNVSQKVNKAFGSTPSLSAADLGKKEIEKLKRCNSWINFEENGEDSVLTNEEFYPIQKIR